VRVLPPGMTAAARSVSAAEEGVRPRYNSSMKLCAVAGRIRSPLLEGG
jgi:hypothetical protein